MTDAVSTPSPRLPRAAQLAGGCARSPFAGRCSPPAAACGTDGRRTPTPTSAASAEDAATFSNWPLYIDKKTEAPVARPVHEEVRRQGQVRRGHQRQRRVLREGPAAARARPADRARHRGADRLWWPARWVEQRLARAARQEEHPERQEPRRQPQRIPYDPKREYTLPWQSGMTGIGYNPRRPAASSDVNELLDDPKFKGKVTMLSETRDSVGLVMLANGVDPTKVDDDQFDGDREDREGGQGAASSGASPATTTRGRWPRATSWVASAYSGDIVQLQADNPDLRVRRPRRGRDALDGQHDDPARTATRTRPRR